MFYLCVDGLIAKKKTLVDCVFLFGRELSNITWLDFDFI